MTSTVSTAPPTTTRPADRPAPDRNHKRRLVSTTAGLVAGGLTYFLVLLNFQVDLDRTTNAPRIFSGFFDFQARAFLDGRVDIEPGLLGIEGFVHDGLTYMYFPPFPALLRLPILMTTREFDHRLTLLSMAVAWIVLAVVVTKLAWLTLSRVTGSEEISRTSGALVGLFIAAATGGTVLTFDASLPWVYHEVYLWAATGAIGALYWLVRALLHPGGHELRWLCVFALIAIGTRATEGWAVCLVVIGCGLYLRLRRGDRSGRAGWWGFLLAGGVPLAASILLNLYKFDAIMMFPLQDQVWTQVNEQRRLALAANGGSLTGPQFFTTSFMAYLRPDGVRFVDYFPWITVPAEPAPAFNGAYVDQTYRTGSATAFMPLLMGLLLFAAVACFRPRTPERLRVFRAPLIAGVLITGGVMGYGYYSTRYTSDFVPALVVGGALGTALLARAIQSRRRAGRIAVVAATSALVAFSLAAQLAVGYYTAAIYHRGDPLVRYVSLQTQLSGGGLSERVLATDGFPEGGRTDDLAIRGDCETLFLNTGDLYEPWVAVEQRDRVVTITKVGRLSGGEVRVLDVEGKDPMSLDLVVNADGLYRFRSTWGPLVNESEWQFFPTSGELTLGIRNRIEVPLWEITGPPKFGLDTSPGVASFPSSYFDQDWEAVEGTMTINSDASDWQEVGLGLEAAPGRELQLCREVARRAGLDTSS